MFLYHIDFLVPYQSRVSTLNENSSPAVIYSGDGKSTKVFYTSILNDEVPSAFTAPTVSKSNCLVHYPIVNSSL